MISYLTNCSPYCVTPASLRGAFDTSRELALVEEHVHLDHVEGRSRQHDTARASKARQQLLVLLLRQAGPKSREGVGSEGA